MSSTAIDFPSNRSQLDPSLNSPPFDDVPLLDGDIFVAAGSSYTWTLDTGETYGRWRNEDPGATGDGRYVKLEDAGKTQVINGGGVLSINDKIKLDGSDGSAEFAADVNVGNRNPGSSSSAGTRIANESGVSGVYTQSNSSVNQSSFAFQALRGTDEIFKVSYNGSAEFAGPVEVGNDPRNGTNAGTRLGTTTGVTATGDTGAQYIFSGYNVGNSTRTAGIQANGSAEFAGDLNQGESWNRTANQRSVLIVDGAVYAQRNSTDGSNPVFRGTLSTTDSSDAAITSQIKADGSATFAGGNVELRNFDDDYGTVAIRNTGGNQFYLTYAESDVLGLTARSGTIANQTQPIKFNGVDGSAEFTGAINGNSYYGYHDGDTSNSSSMRFNARARDVGGDFQLYDANGTSNRTIYLDGSDGSATFAAGKFEIDSRGYAKSIRRYDGDSYNTTLEINTSSGPSFLVGSVTSGGGPRFSINQDGSATFGSASSSPSARHTITAYNSSPDTETTSTFFAQNTAGGRLWKGSNGSTETCTIYADGSATFKGAVEANGGFTVNGVGVFSIFQALRTAVDSATNFDDLKAAMQQALSDFGGTPTPQPAPTPTPTPEPTPDPTNLIPDDWTHIEKLKALKELITEMDL